MTSNQNRCNNLTDDDYDDEQYLIDENIDICLQDDDVDLGVGFLSPESK